MDTPIPPGVLAQLEGDMDALQPLLSPVRKKVVFANELDTAGNKKGEGSKKEGEEGTAVEGDKKETVDRDAENKNKRKATEVKAGTGSSRPKIARRKSWSERMAGIGSKVSYGLGAPRTKRDDDGDGPPRKRSV
ncbi:hypothetical protein B0T21DRAFT_361163 [Apiosordaria backusii]|uniref:Uncharacterized protein n=1 Tax=Apiosordaria backusii TaxID=314023 RepID=A0AA40K1E5_9PEZI|nr:hypothetical protein B0T21DRAFT_361163 [Apiosordaria backusii]